MNIYCPTGVLIIYSSVFSCVYVCACRQVGGACRSIHLNMLKWDTQTYSFLRPTVLSSCCLETLLLVSGSITQTTLGEALLWLAEDWYACCGWRSLMSSLYVLLSVCSQSQGVHLWLHQTDGAVGPSKRWRLPSHRLPLVWSHNVSDRSR